MSSVVRFIGWLTASRQSRSAPWAGKLRRRFAPFGMAICGALVSAVAFASDQGICQVGDPTNAGLGLARIVSSHGADLRKAEAPCPDDSDRCKSKIHLKKNGLVLTGRVNGPYVCVYAAGSYPHDGGYVKQTDIVSDPPLPLRAWKGKWRNGDDWIKLRVDGSALSAEGEAYWPSAHPSSQDAPGGPHTGDMAPGPATPHDNVAVFAFPDDASPDGCRVIAALRRSQLIVSDNGNCGGMNVNFSGLYARR